MNALRLGPKFWYIAHLRMTTEIAKFSDCKKLNLTKCGWNFLLVMPRYKRFFIAMAVVSKFYLQNFYTKKKKPNLNSQFCVTILRYSIGDVTFLVFQIPSAQIWQLEMCAKVATVSGGMQVYLHMCTYVYILVDIQKLKRNKNHLFSIAAKFSKISHLLLTAVNWQLAAGVWVDMRIGVMAKIFAKMHSVHM